MKTTIDAAGRIVIPKRIREQAGLRPGAELEVRYCDGHVEVEAAIAGNHLERRGRFLVVVPDDPVGELSPDLVQDVLEAIRAERGTIRPDDDDASAR